MKLANVDSKLDLVVGPHARRRIEPGDDDRARAISVGVRFDLRELGRLFRVDDYLLLRRVDTASER